MAQFVALRACDSYAQRYINMLHRKKTFIFNCSFKDLKREFVFESLFSCNL